MIVFLLMIVPVGDFSQINDSIQRQVKLQGAVNARDLGGYATKNAGDSRPAVWNRRQFSRTHSINRGTKNTAPVRCMAVCASVNAAMSRAAIAAVDAAVRRPA